MKKIILIIIGLLFLGTASLFSQSIFKNTELVIGGSLQEQDRRLFTWPGQAGVLMREKDTDDYEFNLYLKRSFFTKHRFQTSVGLGYSRFVSVFSRPYQQYQFGIISRELRHVGRHVIHKMIVPIEVQYRFLKSRAISLGIQAIPSFSFRRKIYWPRLLDGTKNRETDAKKWEFAPYNLEINPFVGVRFFRKVDLSFSYRWKHIQKIDRVIFFEGLFRDEDFSFLEKKTDNYNPTKVSLNFGYLF